MYPKREAFRKPLIVMVAAEVRFTDAPRLRQKETLDAVAIALEGRFPFTEPLTGINVENLGPGVPPRVEPRQGVVLRNADSTESLTVMASSLTYETTSYGEFNVVQANMTAACRALVDANVRPALKRVGLRYIYEIRVPEPVTDVRAWSKWIAGSLLGPLAITPDHVPARGVQGAVAFDLGRRGGLNFQYAAFKQGSTTIPSHLRRQPFEPGPFFALDFDGFYEFGGDASVELDAAVVADMLSGVHAPMGAAFQRAVTDQARALFRGDAARPTSGTDPARDPARHRSNTALASPDDSPHLPVGAETDTLG
jgi:uncharacterized protein (TIGR04255 family)